MAGEPEEMLTVNEAAKFLKVSRITLYRMCDRNEVPYYTLPGVEGRRFKRTELLRLLRPGNERARRHAGGGPAE